MIKSIYKWLIVVATIVAIPSLQSCSSDDEPNINDGTGDTVNPKDVFPQGVYKPSGISAITTDENGLVSSLLTTDGDKVTFQYVGVTSRSEEPYILMTIDNGYEYGDKYELKMFLNSAGYVKYCEEIEYRGDKGDVYNEYWWFEYNSNGQLNYMKRSESDETTNITYSDGDIVAVKMYSEDDGELELDTDAKISYTSATNASPIDNIGGIMLFDACFDIDLDEMEYAYYAGLLGKATKHLPLSLTEEGYDKGEYSYNLDMSWTLNENGLPTSVEFTEYGYSYSETLSW